MPNFFSNLPEPCITSNYLHALQPCELVCLCWFCQWHLSFKKGLKMGLSLVKLFDLRLKDFYEIHLHCLFLSSLQRMFGGNHAMEITSLLGLVFLTTFQIKNLSRLTSFNQPVSCKLSSLRPFSRPTNWKRLFRGRKDFPFLMCMNYHINEAESKTLCSCALWQTVTEKEPWWKRRYLLSWIMRRQGGMEWDKVYCVHFLLQKNSLRLGLYGASP